MVEGNQVNIPNCPCTDDGGLYVEVECGDSSNHKMDNCDVQCVPPIDPTFCVDANQTLG